MHTAVEGTRATRSKVPVTRCQTAGFTLLDCRPVALRRKSATTAIYWGILMRPVVPTRIHIKNTTRLSPPSSHKCHHCSCHWRFIFSSGEPWRSEPPEQQQPLPRATSSRQHHYGSILQILSSWTLIFFIFGIRSLLWWRGSSRCIFFFHLRSKWVSLSSLCLLRQQMPVRKPDGIDCTLTASISPLSKFPGM
jgi:hypothetical protein